MSEMRPRIIRKLGSKETQKLNSEFGRSFARTTRVSTELDLFTRPALLNQAIRLWMSTHPFLRAKIAEADAEYCFVYNDRFDGEWMRDSADIENVKYLVFDLSKIPNILDREAFLNDFSWLVTEMELSPEFDTSSELLWRLVVLDISEAFDDHEFYITLVLHHSISEGRNIHMLVLQLLDLVEYCWYRDASSLSDVPLREFKVQPSLEELFFDNFDNTRFSNERFRGLELVPRAKYLETAEASEIPKPRHYKWAEELSDQWIYKLEARGDSVAESEFLQLGRLVESSKTINIKSRRFTLSEQNARKLIEQCKKEGSTVTLVLVNLVAFSLKKLDFLTSQVDEKLNENYQFNTFIPITMRQFETTLDDFRPAPEFTDELTMGFYINGTVMALQHLMSLGLDQLDVLESFWTSCRSSTDHLRAIIHAKEMYFPLELKQRKPESYHAAHVVSSLGVIPTKLPERYALSPRACFRIKQTFSEISVSAKDCAVVGPLYLFTSTCNGRLNMSFLYNSAMLSHANMDQFLELFFALLRKLLA